MHLSAEDLGLVYEVPQAKRLLNRKAEEGVIVETLQQLAKFLEPYKDAFHSLFRLIIIALLCYLSVPQAAILQAKLLHYVSNQNQPSIETQWQMADMSNLADLSADMKRATLQKQVDSDNQ